MGTDQPKVPGNASRLRNLGLRPRGPNAGLENPRPGPAPDLRRRTDRLPPGHPSSPLEADGARRPPAPRLRDIALPEPLTDAEHAEHVKDVRDRLDKARVRGLATDELHTIDPDKKTWSRERREVHREITDTIYAQNSHVPTDRCAIIAGGLGGAGKSTVLDRHAGIDRSQYLTINPDKIKEEMAKRGLIPHLDGLSPMEASDLAHEESSYIAKRLARRALTDCKNVIWDITMSSHKKTGRIEVALGRLFVGVFVDIPVERGDPEPRHREDRGLLRLEAGGGLSCRGDRTAG